MTRTRTTMLAMLVALATLVPMNAVPAGATTGVVLSDIAADANGVNDNGEGLVTNIRTPASIAEADVRSVAIRPLRNRRGTTIGYRVLLTTTGPPGQVLATGTPLRYGVIMQLTPNCRMGVYHTGRGASGSARLKASCQSLTAGLSGDGKPLASRIRNRTIFINVPFQAGPGAMRAGQDVEYTGVYSAIAPGGVLAGGIAEGTDIDTGLTYRRWRIPR